MTQTRRVVLAPDKFTGSRTAAEVAEAMASGVAAGRGFEARIVPATNGGDGSVAAALIAGWTSRPTCPAQRAGYDSGAGIPAGIGNGAVTGRAWLASAGR
jgi:glycerate kinase